MQPGYLSGRRITRDLAWLALAGVAAYAAIDVALAFLRPDYSLLYNAESDYGHGGPWAWLMDLNFLLRCALSLAAAGALSGRRRACGARRRRAQARARQARVLSAQAGVPHV